MKIKKYLILLLILCIIINITSINAEENNTAELKTNNENTVEIVENTDYSYDNNLSQNYDNQTSKQEILSQNNDDNVLSEFSPVSTGITLTIKNTTDFETTNNITINMHLTFVAVAYGGEFPTYNITIYENNSIINTLNIGELKLNEPVKYERYYADIPFNYTVHENSFLTTSLFGVYSNSLYFKNVENTVINYLNNTQIIIDNIYTSNQTWNNSIKSLKKALEQVKNNGIITLNNIQLIQDTEETIPITKNITIIGNNTSLKLNQKQTLLEINPNTQVTLTNILFHGNSNYIISNKGKLQLINCIFEENSNGLIENNGELELINCKIENINQVYQNPTTNENGLINNNGNLKITNTTFNNDNTILPYNLPLSTTLNGIIYNTAELTLDNVTFTNMNNRPLYNLGNATVKNTKFYSILASGSSKLELTSSNQQINQKYYYNNYKIKSEHKTVDGGVIYNDKNLVIENCLFDTTSGSDGGAIYNTNQTIVLNSTFKSIIGNVGGAIYNTNKLIIEDTLFDNIQPKSNGVIYNIGTLNINNTQINKSKGNAIYNNGILNINNTQINKTSTSAIYNNGLLNINNSIMVECSGIGAAIYNTNIANIENCQIINNRGLADTLWRYEEQSNGQVFAFVDKVYSGVIYNGENANANITKSLIKNNEITSTTNGNWFTYYGNIKNDGILKISGCIFDNNNPVWDFFTGDGSFNIYNTGKITVMYSYLVNTKIYIGESTGSGVHSPHSFLYNTGKGTCDINYNFYCLNPSSIIQNANYNYYFIPSFEDDYYPIKLNQSKNITLTLKLTNNIDTIEFNDWDMLPQIGLNTTITIINKNEELININTLLKDKLTFNFNHTNTKDEYTVYANILNNIITTLVDVGKEFPEMTVTYNNITYNDGNNITFHIKVAGNLTVQPTGNITLTYNNQKITINLTEGKCKYTITEKLKPANYTMRIDYNGDSEYFRIIKQYYPFTVHKIPTNITLIAPEIKIGETGHATITITPGTSKLIGYLYVNGVRKTKADTTSTRTLKLNNYGVGTYNLTVIFDEDEYYLGGQASTLFIVSRYETSITVEGNDIKTGENETLNITIQPGDVRGEATISINNENRTIFLNNTTTPITLTDLEEGTYTVTVYYLGDSKYAPSNATTTFSVSRITSQLNVELTHYENLTGHIKIQANPSNCTGEVAIYINNEKTILNLTHGTIDTTINLKRGTNYIYIHYNGDSTYSISTWNTTINLESTPVLSLETQKLETGKTGYIRINLTDTNNIPYEYTNITIEFQNTTKTLTTNENGTVYMPVNTQTGTYTIKATYQNATISKNITVKTLTQLTVNIQNINQADDLMAYATLTDSNNNKLSGEIILEISGKYYKIIITNGEGSRNLGEFTTGTYTYTATYPENTILYSTNTTGTFNVAANNYRITGNTNIVQYYGATKYYKIRLTNNNQPVKGEIINIKINKNTVQVKTDSQGYATLKLSLKVGKYTITSTYKNIKVSNKITVKPTLITKNKKIKKGKTLTYTAKLLNKNGKKLKNKKITFKINGKKYKAKTNKKGIAKIKVKNLKKGKYKIKTSYGKIKNTNTITVK